MNYLWKPSSKLVKNSILNQFTKNIDVKFEKNFKKLWLWSIENPEKFWSKFWDFSKIIGDKGNKIIVKDKVFNKSKFFPDRRLNYAENILKKRSNEVAINFLSEHGIEEEITWNELHERVCRFSAYLKKLNLKKGDRVAAYTPNKIECVICFFLFIIFCII